MSPRRLYVLVSSLPPESRLWAIQSDVPYGWTPQVSMTADVYHALTGEAHPAAPKARSSKKNSRVIAERLRAQKERLAEARPST